MDAHLEAHPQPASRLPLRGLPRNSLRPCVSPPLFEVRGTASPVCPHLCVKSAGFRNYAEEVEKEENRIILKF